MPDNKVITLKNLERFKQDLYNDAPWDDGGSSGSGVTKGEFDISANSDEWTQEQIQDIYENKYDIVSVTKSDGTVQTIYKVVEDEGYQFVAYIGYAPYGMGVVSEYEPNGEGIICFAFKYDSFSETPYSVTDHIAAPFVDGTNDGTNWTSIKIGNVTYAIPQANDAGTKLYKHVIRGSESGQLTIINARATPFTNWTGIASNGSFISAYFDGPTTLYSVVLVNNSGTVYGYNQTGTISNLSAGTFVSDTVTPL